MTDLVLAKDDFLSRLDSDKIISVDGALQKIAEGEEDVTITQEAAATYLQYAHYLARLREIEESTGFGRFWLKLAFLFRKGSRV